MTLILLLGILAALGVFVVANYVYTQRRVKALGYEAVPFSSDPSVAARIALFIGKIVGMFVIVAVPSRLLKWAVHRWGLLAYLRKIQ